MLSEFQYRCIDKRGSDLVRYIRSFKEADGGQDSATDSPFSAGYDIRYTDELLYLTLDVKYDSISISDNYLFLRLQRGWIRCYCILCVSSACWVLRYNPNTI